MSYAIHVFPSNMPTGDKQLPQITCQSYRLRNFHTLIFFWQFFLKSNLMTDCDFETRQFTGKVPRTLKPWVLIIRVQCTEANWPKTHFSLTLFYFFTKSRNLWLLRDIQTWNLRKNVEIPILVTNFYHCIHVLNVIYKDMLILAWSQPGY